MIEDLPEIREQLTDHWQKACMDLIGKGFQPQPIFETVLTVGLAGFVEVHGKEAAARKLVQIAQSLAEQVQEEMQASEEAARATKN